MQNVLFPEIFSDYGGNILARWPIKNNRSAELFASKKQIAQFYQNECSGEYLKLLIAMQLLTMLW